ncbi:tRNA threonylcarbamoyladenosine dehydratase [Clostridia bacterium]|nr:tRNA threonylcarbamoyladenosine dehydratase [Clostridia bacterium]
MESQHHRTEILIGASGMEKLRNSHVLVVGVGGVGSFVVEGLVRAGIGTLTLVDFDTIQISNLNRQIMAYHSTLGRKKVDVLAERIADINPEATVYTLDKRYSDLSLDLGNYDYIVDAIDSVDDKVDLIEQAIHCNSPIISSMGTGNKLDNTRFLIEDISKTHTCPLARTVRRKLKLRGINKGVNVLFSSSPIRLDIRERALGEIGSISTVPSVAGLMLANKVLKDLLEKEV